MKILAVSSRSVTIELDSSKPYFFGEEFVVSLNGVPVKKETRNVFSLFSLVPDTEYTAEAAGQKIFFKTDKETALFDVTAFRALGDGVHDDTPAFAAAIACLPEGGTLFVPAGRYLLTSVFLKSNITIYLDEGATLSGNVVRSLFPVLPALIDGENLGTWQGEEADCFSSIITAYCCKNVKIIGEGEINCNAQDGDWYINHRVKRIAWRPRGVFFNRCEDVLLQGITIKNTPSWNVHPYFCKSIKLLNLCLENTPNMPTTDGIDPDCCDGVLIAGVKISVGDDCIALKSGTVESAKKYRTPCRDVEIRNCLMCEGHGGVVLGSELSGGIEDITVSRCIFEGTDRGLRIKTRRGRGRVGVTDDITFENIEMRAVKVPFVVNMYYNMGDETGHTEYVYTTKKLPVDDRTPYIGKFKFKDMTCTDVSVCAGAFYGLPEAPVGGVNFENVSFSYADDAEAGYPDMKEINEKVRRGGLYFQFVEEVTLNGVTITGCDGEPIVCDGVNKFKEIKR